MPKAKKRGQGSLATARACLRAALAKKGEDPVLLDVRQVSSFADYFLIVSGRSTRHVQGLAGAIDKELSSKRLSASNTEGYGEGLWVLLDYGDVVAHIFYKETRAFYDLEGLWHDAPRLDPTKEALK